ncbi:tyrosine-type recombinase/integrase [Phenylobacterium soli]|uniref:Integrase n=1 Tax=Phenylobacterium soli TaxID=2170551 RepID=A0A328AKA4_9CAUL|nr:tyrosine-type recombinase/integrase [Phenylobacterium soli]RAK54901.1 integrase [Phenylobacterium soli]
MSNKRVKLTRKLVESVALGPQDAFLWDSEVVGFGVKVSRGGQRSYILQYRIGGRSRRFTIGTHGSPWTPETARDRAKILLGQVAGGVDPQDEKAEDRKALTVAELCDLYVTEGLATRKPLSVVAAKADIENHIKPLLGSKPANAVTPGDVDKLLTDIAAGRTAKRSKTARKRGLARVTGGKGAANSAITTLCAAFNFGVRRGVRPDNPALGVRKYPEKKLERFLSPAELARLGEALAAAEALGVESPYALAAIRLLILTGCRRNEILTLKRSYVDEHNSCLRLPDSKTGAKIVHIGDAALEVIQAVPEVVGNPYLLPGRKGEGHIVDLQSTWERIRAAAGLSDVRLHDLRHAFASLGAASGDSLLVIGSLLGHKSAKTTHRYAHLADHPLKDAANRISAEVARLMGTTSSGPAKPARRANVVPAPPGTKGVLGEVIETKWLDTPAAAAFLGHTVGTLQTYRWMGTGPRFRKIGRRVVYALGDLEAWRSEQAASSSARAA